MKIYLKLTILSIFGFMATIAFAADGELTPADKIAASNAGISLAGTAVARNAVVGNVECPTRRAVVVKHTDGSYSAVVYDVAYVPYVRDYFRREDEPTAKDRLRGSSIPTDGLSVVSFGTALRAKTL